MTFHRPPQHAWQRYLGAVVIVAGAFVARLPLIGSLESGYPYITYYPAVVLAAFFGGMRPGLLAALLSAGLVISMHLPTEARMMGADWIAMAVFLGSAAVMSGITQAMHHARSKLESVAEDLRHTNKRLRMEVAEREEMMTERGSLAAVVQYSDDAIITKNLEGRVTSWNAAATRMFGYAAEEMIGNPISILLPPGYENEEEQNLAKIRRGETIEHFETRRRCKDGRIIDVAMTHSPLRSPGGAIIGASKIARDITEQKRAAESILHSQREEHARRMEMEALMEAVPAMVWIARDPECRDIRGNRAGCDFLRVPRDTNLGLSFSKHAGDQVERLQLFKDGQLLSERDLPLQRVASSGRPAWGEELEGKFSDGSVAWIYGNVVPLLSGTGCGHGAIAVFVDITKRKAVEQQLAAARDAAESASRSKDQFLAMLSHELRTPLTPVLMLATAMEKAEDLAPGLRQDFAMIRSNIELEAQIIDDLLDVTRITQDKLQLNIQPCDAHALIRRTEAILQADIEARRLVFRLELAAGDHQVLGDAVRLQQVFWNVVKNAVKFTPAGGSIVVRTSNENDALHVQVTDTGAGIASEDLERIFEAFAQAGDGGSGTGTANRFGGLGLGLAISSLLVKKHRGRIWAESPGLGCGASFHVCLPLAVSQRPAGQPLGISTQSFSLKGLRILLIEDHDDSRQTLTRLLGRRGHAVTPAATMRAALEAASTGVFDLVICDRGLPDGDGSDLMTDLRRQYALPGIALSGFGMEADIQKSLDSGFLEHLTKPVNLAVLEKAMARVIEKTASKCGSNADMEGA